MTLLNYYFTAERVDLLSDTLVTYQGQPWSFTSKAIILPHAHAVLAHRGPTLFLWAIGEALQPAFHEGGVDGLVEVLPAICRRAHAGVVDHFPEDQDLHNQLVAIGWSPSKREFAVAHLFSCEDFMPELREPGAYFSPAKPGERAPVIDTAPTEGVWIRLAEVQREVLAEESAARGDASSVGGDLILTALSRASISVRKIHRFDDYEQALAIARERCQKTTWSLSLNASAT